MKRRTRASLWKRAMRATGGYLQSWVALAAVGEDALRDRAAYMWRKGYNAACRDQRSVRDAYYRYGYDMGVNSQKQRTIGNPSLALLHVLDTQRELKAKIHELTRQLKEAQK